MRISLFLLLLTASTLTFSQKMNTPESIYAFTMNRIDGTSESLEVYSGKVVLIVNVASHCGYTPQYNGLEALYQEFKDSGLVVLGFPANQFAGQEPGTNEEIQSFCSSTYNVTFPLFEKIVVKGKEIHPLYEYLTLKEQNGVLEGEVKWNFQKFLIARDGKVSEMFLPKVSPDDPEFREAVIALLHAK